MLPPVVGRRLEDTKDDFGTVRFAGRDLDEAGDGRKRAVRNALCWAYHLGWTKTAAIELATELLRGDDLEGRVLARQAQVLVDGGTFDSKDGGQVAGSRPTLSVVDSVEYLEAIRARVLNRSVLGTTDPKDRGNRKVHSNKKAMLAVCELAQSLQFPSIELVLSGRQLAVAADMNHKTAESALRRLVAEGYLKVVSPAHGFDAARYLIRWPEEAPALGHCVLSRSFAGPLGTKTQWPSSGTTSALHPVFSDAALGVSGHRLLDHLTRETPSTAAEWYRGAGVSKKTFYRVHRKLTGDADGVVLAVKTDEGWRLSPSIDRLLETVAESTGATVKAHERSQNRTARFNEQRVGHHEYRLRWGIRTGVLEPLADGNFVHCATGEIVAPRAALKLQRLPWGGATPRATAHEPDGAMSQSVLAEEAPMTSFDGAPSGHARSAATRPTPATSTRRRDPSRPRSRRRGSTRPPDRRPPHDFLPPAIGRLDGRRHRNDGPIHLGDLHHLRQPTTNHHRSKELSPT